MSDVLRSEPVITSNEIDPAALSWSAIAAGAAAAMAITLILLALGSAVGFSSVSPWSGSGVSAGTFKIATGLYLVFVALVASTIGGYMSGRLRNKWTRLQNYEVQFRDTAHGFLAWALATIVGAALLGGAATFMAGGAASGAAAGASSAATQAGPNDYFAGMLFRPGANRPTANGTAVDADREAAAILSRSIANGDVAAADRSYLVQLVSARTGLNPADAEKRVTEVIAQAKTAADQARKAAASLSIWLTISMLVGAFAASLAAIEGGQLRDRRWKGIIGGRAYTENRIEN